MRTNNQRAELILEKANTLKQSGLDTVPEPKRKIVWWKVVTAVTCALVILAGSITGLIFGLKNYGYNIDKMFIANFNSYTAIGSGHINQSGQTASATNNSYMASMGVAYAESSGNSDDNYLVGQKEDGSFEKLFFSKTQNGKPEKEQEGNITQILSFSRFTFIEWNLDIKHHGGGENCFFVDYGGFSWSYKTFVIDNKTGKIFDLSKTGIGTIRFATNELYELYNWDSEDCVYFFDDNGSIYENVTCYKASIENEELKIEEVINTNLIKFIYTSTFTDKYGNLYLSDEAIYNSNINSVNGNKQIINVKYCISNGNVIDVNKKLFRSVNGIVYTEDKTMKVNENGELVPNSFMDCNLILSKENIIKKEGNVEYYYGNPSSKTNDTMLKNIYKVTWSEENAEEYTYEVIPVDAYTKTYVTTSDKIYFLGEEEIFAVEIATGNKIEQAIGTDYIFNSIKTDNIGNVLFEGITKSGMNSVGGIIDNDGNIDISQKNRKYVIYYIKPLN